MGTFPVSAGKHRVLVKATGYFDAEASIDAKAAGASDVVLTPVPSTTSEPLNWRRVGGFVGLGAGVAFGAVGLVSVLQVNGTLRHAVRLAWVRGREHTSPGQR